MYNYRLIYTLYADYNANCVMRRRSIMIRCTSDYTMADENQFLVVSYVAISLIDRDVRMQESE